MRSYVETAKEVIDGKWGNGEMRRRLLEEAGYDYDKVQDIVNRILRGETVEEPVEKENENEYYDLTISLSKYKGIKLTFTD